MKNTGPNGLSRANGKPKGEYGRRSRHFVNKVSICWYALSGCASIKPGGTAGYNILSQHLSDVGRDFFIAMKL